MNNVMLIGRMTADPELRYTQNQTAVARFVLAVDRPLKQGEERQADFIRITAWSRTAELVQRYTGKGSKIAVEGRIQTGSYKDKDDKTVFTTDIIANRIEFLDSRQQAQPQADCPSDYGRPQQPQQQAQPQGRFDIPEVFQAVDEGMPW